MSSGWWDVGLEENTRIVKASPIGNYDMDENKWEALCDQNKMQFWREVDDV